MAITDEDFAAANARGRKRLRTASHAVAARYDGERDRIVVELSTGAEVAFPPHDAQGLETAKPEDLADIAIDPPRHRVALAQARRGSLPAGAAGRPARLQGLGRVPHGAGRRQGAHPRQAGGRARQRPPSAAGRRRWPS